MTSPYKLPTALSAVSGKHPCRRDPLQHFNLSGPAQNKRAAGLTASLCEIASTEVVLFAPVPLLALSISSPSSQLGKERVWRKGGKGKEENMDLEIQSSQDSTTSCSFILNGIYKAFVKFNSTVSQDLIVQSGPDRGAVKENPGLWSGGNLALNPGSAICCSVFLSLFVKHESEEVCPEGLLWGLNETRKMT